MPKIKGVHQAIRCAALAADPKCDVLTAREKVIAEAERLTNATPTRTAGGVQIKADHDADTGHAMTYAMALRMGVPASYLRDKCHAKADLIARELCIDQVEFMAGLMRPDRLRDRILIWAEEEIRAGSLPVKSDTVLKAVLYQGQIERGEVESILGTSDRTARRVTSALLEAGALSSVSTRAPLKLAFPAKYAGRWMPGLFPDRED
mgnify:CR=1 FL=1